MFASFAKTGIYTANVQNDALREFYSGFVKSWFDDDIEDVLKTYLCGYFTDQASA